MADESNQETKVKVEGKAKAKAKAKPAREQSTISFPYMDLEQGISVARGILSGGGVALTRDQLAGVMNLAAASGNFVSKVATARLFGLVNFNAGKYELTELGFDILDSDEKRQKKARAEAFLMVPLYRRVYEEFRGRQLPPRPLGLESAFVKFGVAPKQKGNARLAFDKSAAQAGFFPNGSDRLIEPILAPASSDRARGAEAEVESEAQSEAQSFAIGHLHPFVQGLLDTLPEPQTNWTMEGRAKWLQAAANIFDLIYKGDGKISVMASESSDKKPVA